MANKLVFTFSLIAIVSSMGAANFVFTESNPAFAQSQSPCASTVTITDSSQLESGVLIVLSNTMQAGFVITGPATYDINGAIWSQRNILAGTYTITWKAVSGCGTPPPETKTTNSKGSLTFAGNYKDLSIPAGYGLIDIKTNLNQPTIFTISGPAKQTATGTGFTWASAPAGTYTITYGSVTGYNTPLSETKILNVGGTLNFYGSYTIKKTRTSDVQYFTIESKPMLGANAYVDGVFVGKTPVRATARYGSRVQVRCSLNGYKDSYAEYRASDPGSGVIVVDPRAYCFITEKTVSNIQPSQPSPLPTPATTRIPTTSVVSTPKTFQESDVPESNIKIVQKPRGFFRNIGYSVRSFFSAIFSKF